MRRTICAVLSVCVVMTTVVVPVVQGAPNLGRWKQGGDGSCYWDENDDGPDQCDPNAPVQSQGRWKIGGDASCYWDGNDGGPNQCLPPEAVSPDEPMSEIEQDIQRLGEAAEELTAMGFTNSTAVTESNVATMVEVFERHGLWDGMSSTDVRAIIMDGIAARKVGTFVGWAIPRNIVFQQPQVIPNPKLRFPQPSGTVPLHPQPVPSLEDCWVMKQKAHKLTELSRTLAGLSIMLASGLNILKGSVPMETPIKKLPMLSRFIEPLVLAGIATGMGAWVTGSMASEYSYAPCRAQGESSWIAPSTRSGL